jgi:hypothetical protein
VPLGTPVPGGRALESSQGDRKLISFLRGIQW